MSLKSAFNLKKLAGLTKNMLLSSSTFSLLLT